jgi:membrane protease YdiL (CAAX protease family)
METAENQAPVVDGTPVRAVRRSFFVDVPWRWRDVLICFAPSVFVSSVRRFLPIAFLGWLQWFWLPSMVVGLAWLIGSTLWAARSRRGVLPGLPRIRRIVTELPWALLVLPAAFGTMIAVDAVASMLLRGVVPPSAGWAPITRLASRAELIGFAIIALVVAPIAEELAYRGLLYNKLRQALPKSLALPLQAVAFGLVHYPLGITVAFAVGAVAIVFGLFYEWRKTLVAPVLLHASVNLIGLAMLTANAAADANSPRLGIYTVAGEQGCVVTEVLAGSAADRAGLRPRDVVTALDGTAVANFGELYAIVRQKRVGDEITVDFTRERMARRVVAVLTR